MHTNKTHVAPLFMSQSAIYEFLGTALETNHQIKMPTKIAKTRRNPIHSFTGETITKYKKLMEDQITTKVWTKSMSNESGRLSQGFGNEKGTNTINWMTHEQIHTIPKDIMVTYAIIVVGYRDQKKDTNRV